MFLPNCFLFSIVSVTLIVAAGGWSSLLSRLSHSAQATMFRAKERPYGFGDAIVDYDQRMIFESPGNIHHSVSTGSNYTVVSTVRIRVTPLDDYLVSWYILWACFVLAALVATWQVVIEYRQLRKAGYGSNATDHGESNLVSIADITRCLVRIIKISSDYHLTFHCGTVSSVPIGSHDCPRRPDASPNLVGSHVVAICRRYTSGDSLCLGLGASRHLFCSATRHNRWDTYRPLTWLCDPSYGTLQIHLFITGVLTKLSRFTLFTLR